MKVNDKKRQFVNFGFYKVRPEWRKLSNQEREKGKQEFISVLEEYSKQIIILPYTLVGIRGDCDFMLWKIGCELKDFTDLQARLFGTGIGPYLETPYYYLAMTRRSIYFDPVDPSHDGERTKIIPGKRKFLFVYPFIKTRDWYALSKEKRQEMMTEHIITGNRYPSVKLNTTYSYGLDDQEFVVAFETDNPEDFLDLVMELRESQASRYTKQDTPTFTCMAANIREVLNSLMIERENAALTKG
ncbi:MAG: chlorite dismutase family protein [Candidatus Eremiobacteraeota bacterium]|nr:chlorite dismutase family protein [Candidatus Eremiobacteraeota bacterium]MCL5054348.1 chlorite dismutase family protein [Bacillota bacterium]